MKDLMKILGFACRKSDFERRCSCLMLRIGLICQTVVYFVYRQKLAYIYALAVRRGQQWHYQKLNTYK